VGIVLLKNTDMYTAENGGMQLQHSRCNYSLHFTIHFYDHSVVSLETRQLYIDVVVGLLTMYVRSKADEMASLI